MCGKECEISPRQCLSDELQVSRGAVSGNSFATLMRMPFFPPPEGGTPNFLRKRRSARALHDAPRRGKALGCGVIQVVVGDGFEGALEEFGGEGLGQIVNAQFSAGGLLGPAFVVMEGKAGGG